MQWMELINKVLTYWYSYFPITLLTIHIYYPKSLQPINFYNIVYLDFCKYVNVPPPISISS